MIKKEFTPKRTVCKVTFSIPKEKVNKEVAIVGDFNNWDPTTDLLEENGEVYRATLRLNPSSEYSFRYFIDGEKWENDETADEYVTNEFGTENSVVVIGK